MWFGLKSETTFRNMPPSPQRFLIIDGHSIIHAWEDLRKLHLRGATRYQAREELLKRMRLLRDMTAESVVVVFDGTGDRISDEREAGGIQIFYADSGHTADTVIERLAAKYAKNYAIRVVTADRMIWETITSLGAHWLSPDDLRFELERAEREMRGKLRK